MLKRMEMNFKQMPQVLKQTAKAMALAGVLGLSACGGSPGAGPVERFESTQVFGVPGVWDHQTGIIWAAALAQEGGPQGELPYAAELLSIADGPADIWKVHFPWIEGRDLIAAETPTSTAPSKWAVHVGDDENGTLLAGSQDPSTWYVLSRTVTPQSGPFSADLTKGLVSGAGLMWQLCTGLTTYVQAGEGEASCGGSATSQKAYSSIQGHVDAVNLAAYGGYSDWRLPTKQELQTLLQLESQSNLLPLAFAPDGVTSLENLPYWTSSTGGGLPWVVDFSPNGAGGVSRDSEFEGVSVAYVRLVRNLP